jgi:excisionase family DNA binding protein
MAQMINPYELLANKLDNLEKMIYEVLHAQKCAINPDKDILNISEASKLTSIATKTIYNFTSQNTIPHFKKGRRVYFEREKLLTWLVSERDTFVNAKSQKQKAK